MILLSTEFVSQTTLKLCQFVSKRLLGRSLSSGMILLSTEFVSQTGSINHRLLRLLLGILGSLKHGVNLSLDGVDGTLQSTLGSHVTAIDDLHVVDGITAISDLKIQLALSTVSAVQQGLAFLYFTGESSSFTFGDANLFHDLVARAGFILVQLDGLLQLSLVALNGLKTLRVCLVGVVQSNLQFVDLTLECLLDTESLTLGLLFSLQRSRHRFHGALVVLPGVVELFLLLGHPPVNLLLDLAELQLSSQYLILLLLKGSLSFLQSSLQLLLLLFQTTSLFVQVMDGAASLAELIKKILDFIREVLVLPLDDIELLNSLISGGLKPEQLRRVVATFILGGGHLSSNISSLGLPLTQNLVKVLSSLLSDEGSSVHPLVLHADIIKVSSHPSFGLFSIGHLGGENIYQFLTLHNLGLELAPIPCSLYP